MYLYIKATYQAWCQDQTDDDIRERHLEFIASVSRAFAVSEQEVWKHVEDAEWCGKPMPLILDHINGINNDNRLENLRFVCSNCDSQLDTYKSRNKGGASRLATAALLKSVEA